MCEIGLISYSDCEHDAFDSLVLFKIHLIHLPVCAVWTIQVIRACMSSEINNSDRESDAGLYSATLPLLFDNTHNNYIYIVYTPSLGVNTSTTTASFYKPLRGDAISTERETNCRA